MDDQAREKGGPMTCSECTGSGACDACDGYGCAPELCPGAGEGPECEVCSGDGVCAECGGTDREEVSTG
jgi:hypothetical protein